MVSIHALLAECDSMYTGACHEYAVSIHALLAECDETLTKRKESKQCFNPRTPCGVRLISFRLTLPLPLFQSTHSLRSATVYSFVPSPVPRSFNPRTPCGVRPKTPILHYMYYAFQSTHSLRSATCHQPPPRRNRQFQSTHSLRSATAPNLIHCYSTKQIILCANLPKKTVIARLLFLSIYLSIFYSQCITPIADLPGNSCELEVGAQAMFNSL